MRGVDRDTAALLALVALAGLFEVGVDLEGEGGTGGEELEEEWQAGAEPGDGRAAEFLLRVLGDDLVERTALRARGCARWAPIHISACGSPVGSTPSRCGMAVVEPQA